MHFRVTVIPTDRLIIVDDACLYIDFPPDLVHNLRALQWEDRRGHLEFVGDTPNYELTALDYTREVQPFIDLFEAEKARLASCPGDFYKWDKAAGQWVFDSGEFNRAYHFEILATLGDMKEKSIEALIDAVLALAEGRTPPEKALGVLKDCRFDLDLLADEDRRIAGQ